MPVPATLDPIGTVGVRGSAMDHVDAATSRKLVGVMETLGFGSVWVPESVGKNPFAQSAILLSATSRLVVGTGIASIWHRDAGATVAATHTLADAFPGRFVLGLGVSHAPIVDAREVQQYDRPFTQLRTYLQRMEAATYRAPLPHRPAPRVLGALGPRSLRLAAEQGMGAHPYFVPVEHTRQARELLGPDAFLAPELAVVVTTTREQARTVAAPYVRRHLGLDNYRRNLERLGFEPAHLGDEVSDTVLDRLIAWGGRDAVQEAITARLEAGADHVVVNPVATLGAGPDELTSIVHDVAAEALR